MQLYIILHLFIGMALEQAAVHKLWLLNACLPSASKLMCSRLTLGTECQSGEL